MLLLGRRSYFFYLNFVKSILAYKKHESVELHGMGNEGNVKVTHVANALTKWGYVTITNISTHHKLGSSLRVIIKKTQDFQKLFDEHDVQAKERREKIKSEKIAHSPV